MTTQRLEKYIVRDKLCSRRAKGALTGHRLVTLDLVTDAEGGTAKPITALADLPFGYIEDNCPDGGLVGVIKDGIVAIVCGDASIEPDIPVYNDDEGRVTAVAGVGASLVGTTMSKTEAEDELVTVSLSLT